MDYASHPDSKLHPATTVFDRVAFGTFCLSAASLVVAYFAYIFRYELRDSRFQQEVYQYEWIWNATIILLSVITLIASHRRALSILTITLTLLAIWYGLPFLYK
jgi:TRAP-type uncharacterized transport system fused permease subunit